MKQQVAGYLSYTTFAVDREESQLILQFFKEEIYERAVGTASVANFLHSVSSAYMNVSRRYIMDRLAGLNSLLTITDTADQQAKLIDLQRESVEVQAAIRSIGLAHKQEFEGECE